jgi:hypothetical protein
VSLLNEKVQKFAADFGAGQHEMVGKLVDVSLILASEKAGRTNRGGVHP